MENIEKSSIETIMQTLVRQYGKELYLPENEIRFKGLLFDVASDFAKELKTLKVAIAERVPAKLLAVDGKDVEEKVRTMQLCRDTLVDDIGLMEDRVMQVLNILADGLGWDTTFYISEDEDETEEDDEKDEEEDGDAKYETLVHDAIGRFPRYASIFPIKQQRNKYTSNSVVIGKASSHIDAKQISECLRDLFEGYFKYNVSLNQHRKRDINSSLFKEKLSKGDIWLVIVGNFDVKSHHIDGGECYTIVIHDIDHGFIDYFIDYELIDGFGFRGEAYFDRKVLQNRLQLK